MLASSLLVVIGQLYLAANCRVFAFHVPTTLLSRRNPLRTSAVIMKVDLAPAKSALLTIKSELGRALSIILDASIQRKLVVIAHPLVMFLLYLIATSKLTKNAANSVAQIFRKLIDAVKSKSKKSEKESVLAASLAKSAESSSLQATHIPISMENPIALSSKSVQQDAKPKPAKLVDFNAQEITIMKSQMAVADAKAKALEVEEKSAGSSAADSSSFEDFNGKYGSEFIIQEAKLLTPELDVADKQEAASKTAGQIAKDASARADAVNAAALEAQKVAVAVAAARLAAEKGKAEKDAAAAKQKKIKEEVEGLALSNSKIVVENSSARLDAKAEARRIAKEAQEAYAKMLIDGIDEGAVLEAQKASQRAGLEVAAALIKKEKVDDQKKAEDMKNMIMFGKLSPEMEANEGRIAAKVEAQRIAKAAQDEYAKMLVDGIDEGAVLEAVKVSQSIAATVAKEVEAKMQAEASSAADKRKAALDAAAAMIKKEKVDDQKKAEDMKNMIMFGKLSPEMEANEGRIAAKANAQRIAREAQEAFEKMMRDDGVDVEPVKVPVFKRAPVAVAVPVAAPKVGAEQAAKKMQAQREAEKAKAAAALAKEVEAKTRAEAQKASQSTSAGTAADKRKAALDVAAAMIKKEKVDDQKKAEDMKNMIMFGKLSPEMEANEGRIAAKANAQRIAREAQEAFEKMMRDDGVDVEPVKVPVFKKAPVAVAVPVAAPKVDAEQAAKKMQAQREAEKAKAAALEAERLATAAKKKAEKKKADEDAAAARKQIKDEAFAIVRSKMLEQTAAIEKSSAAIWTPDIIIRNE